MYMRATVAIFIIALMLQATWLCLLMSAAFSIAIRKRLGTYLSISMPLAYRTSRFARRSFLGGRRRLIAARRR